MTPRVERERERESGRGRVGGREKVLPFSLCVPSHPLLCRAAKDKKGKKK